MYYASKYRGRHIVERWKSCSFMNVLLVKPSILIYALMCIYRYFIKQSIISSSLFNGTNGGHQALAEHQKVLKALGKDYLEWDRVLVWGTILRGQDTVLVVPRLLAEQCPMEQVVPHLGLGEEEQDMALERDMAC